MTSHAASSKWHSSQCHQHSRPRNTGPGEEEKWEQGPQPGIVGREAVPSTSGVLSTPVWECEGKGSTGRACQDHPPGPWENQGGTGVISARRPPPPSALQLTSACLCFRLIPVKPETTEKEFLSLGLFPETDEVGLPPPLSTPQHQASSGTGAVSFSS